MNAQQATTESTRHACHSTIPRNVPEKYAVRILIAAEFEI